MAAPSESTLQTPQQKFSTPKSFTKFTSGKPLLKETKLVILNVYVRLRESLSTITQAISEAARLTGVSVPTVTRIKAESKQFGKPRSPLRRSLDLTRKTPKKNHITKLDSFDTSAIRRFVHQYFSRNEIPTLKKLLEVVNEDTTLPNFSKTTFYRILKSLNFNFRRNKRDSAMITRPELIKWRAKYLVEIKEFRAAGKPIYYLDETWVNVGHTKKKLWHDDTIANAREAWQAGLSTGLKTPSGKGSRLIITHAGNEDGFVANAQDIFEGKKGTRDYHQEMDGNRFEHWFVTKLLPNLKPDSIIVMDNASYHSVQVERIPTTKTRKAEIQEWLTSKGILWTQKMVIKDLLSIVAEVRDRYVAYNIDNIAEEAGHTVLRLPPYHCELNPIELIWSQVKGYVAAQNKSFKIGEVRTLLDDSLKRITAASWEKCVKHVIDKVEPKFWTLDGLTDTTLEPFIITTEGDSDSSSDEDDEDLGVVPLN